MHEIGENRKHSYFALALRSIVGSAEAQPMRNSNVSMTHDCDRTPEFMDGYGRFFLCRFDSMPRKPKSLAKPMSVDVIVDESVSVCLVHATMPSQNSLEI